MRFALFASVFAVLGLITLTPGCNASCKPMEAYGTNMTCNGGAQGYMWTGTSCIFSAVCNCTGRDCQRLYSTQDACETAHFHCK